MSPRSAKMWRMSRLARDGTAEPISRDQMLRRERGQGNIYFLCSADPEQDWQPTRWIYTLLYVMTIQYSRHLYVYMSDDIRTVLPSVCVLSSHSYRILLLTYLIMFLFVFVTCPCMAIYVSVKHNGGFLPDIILLTQCYYHRGTV